MLRRRAAFNPALVDQSDPGRFDRWRRMQAEMKTACSRTVRVCGQDLNAEDAAKILVGDDPASAP